MSIREDGGNITSKVGKNNWRCFQFDTLKLERGNYQGRREFINLCGALIPGGIYMSEGVF